MQVDLGCRAETRQKKFHLRFLIPFKGMSHWKTPKSDTTSKTLILIGDWCASDQDGDTAPKEDPDANRVPHGREGREDD
jgi:hypothetical protein